jgi:tripartite-type tricarboxylate transporter receptor subunit TctC
MRLRLIAAAIGLLCFGARSSLAAEGSGVADFYRGKSVTLYIGSAAGGGFDAYGRLVARHLGRHIPGRPTIVPENMPGAGQTKAAGYVYSLAPKDGTAIAFVSPGALLTKVLGGPTVQYDSAKFQYLGNANSDVYTCIARRDSPVQSFAEALTREWVIGVASGTTRDLPMVLKNVLHAKLKLVAGYASANDLALAFAQDEIQGICGYAYSGIVSEHPDWLSKGTARIILQEANKGYPALDRQGVPLAASFAASDEDRQVLALVYAQGTFGRPFLVAPEVPTDRVEALRAAFMATMRDPDFLADAARMRLDIDPVPAETLQALIAKVSATPDRVLERAKNAMQIE